MYCHSNIEAIYAKALHTTTTNSISWEGKQSNFY